MSKPTNEQLNEAAAKACGWTDTPNHNGPFRNWTSPNGMKSGVLHKYCTDRNALPELWEAVEKAGKGFEFCEALRKIENLPRFTFVGIIGAIKAEPRIHVICFLHVMGQWPEDWIEE